MKRCIASTSGDTPTSTPWRAATKPSAQNKAEPAPHNTPHAVACLAVTGGERSIANHSLLRFDRTTREYSRQASPNTKSPSAERIGVGIVEQIEPAGGDDAAGVEAAARDARYRALDAMCAAHGAQVLWLAQHADDQAETVLLQLLRGAGLAGLAAMAPARASAAGMPRMRPLLALLRAQLERYARAHGLLWIDDESNDDTRYARNALRHDVMLALSAHFPGYRDALARTASHAASSQRLLDDLARIDLGEAGQEEGSALSHAALLALDDARALNLLRYWMRTLGLPAASTARLADALRQLREIAQGDGNGHALRVDHAGHRLRCYRGLVSWEAAHVRDGAARGERTGARTGGGSGEATARTPVELRWHGEEIWRLPSWRGTYVFAPAGPDDPDAVPEPMLASAPLVVRERSGGERLRDDSANVSRTLKNLFQKRGVPAWERDVPLLFVGETLLFVPRIGVNRSAFSTLATHPAAAWRRIEWREDLLIA